MRNYSSYSDAELLRELKNGEEYAFTEIYNRYWQKLLAIGFFYSHDKQEAEDIVHEVLAGLWTRKYNLQVESLESYLATAVRFSVFKLIIRNKRRRELLLKNVTSQSAQDIEENLELRFLEEYLRGVAERLPENARIVFDYSRNKGLTISQIASKMDLSPKAVEYHMTKALKAFRTAIQKIRSVFV